MSADENDKICAIKDFLKWRSYLSDDAINEEVKLYTQEMLKHDDTRRMMKVLTRTVDGDTDIFDSVKEAFEHASRNLHVWKISWSEDDYRIRFVRGISARGWKFVPVDSDDALLAGVRGELS